MLSNLAPVVALALAALRVTAYQVPLSIPEPALDNTQYATFTSMLDASGTSATDTLSTLIMSKFSAQEREELMLNLLKQHDVVDVMRMTGHGDGLEEVRLLQVDGENKPRL